MNGSHNDITDFIQSRGIDFVQNGEQIMMFIPLKLDDGYVYGHKACRVHGLMHTALLLRGFEGECNV